MHSLSYGLWAPKDVIVAFFQICLVYYDHQKFHHHIVDMNQLRNYKLVATSLAIQADVKIDTIFILFYVI
jgi:hypothetical protein